MDKTCTETSPICNLPELLLSILPNSHSCLPQCPHAYKNTHVLRTLIFPLWPAPWLLSIDTPQVNLHRCTHQNHPKSLKTRLSIPHPNPQILIEEAWREVWADVLFQKLPRWIWCADVKVQNSRGSLNSPLLQGQWKRKTAHHWVSLLDNNLLLCVSFPITTGYLSIFTHFLGYCILELYLLNDSRPVCLQWTFAFPHKRIIKSYW